MKLRIDGREIGNLSIDEIGATLQQIAEELSTRETRVGRIFALDLPILDAVEGLNNIADKLRKL